MTEGGGVILACSESVFSNHAWLCGENTRNKFGENVVAVGMIGCKKNNKKANLLGYNAMLERIEPSAVICFGKPFPEMKGKLIVVDYMASRKVVR